MLESENVPQGANGTITSEIPAPKRASMKQIARMAAAMFGISTEELMGRRRERRYAWPRQFATSAMRAYGQRGIRSLAWSYPAIGKFMGLDHTTVLHSETVLYERVANDPAYSDAWFRMQRYCDDPQVFETDFATAQHVQKIIDRLRFPHLREYLEAARLSKQMSRYWDWKFAMERESRAQQ